MKKIIIDEKTREKINAAIIEKKRRERLWENEDKREKRKSREYCNEYNRKNGASVKNAMSSNKNTRVRICATKSQWQWKCENEERKPEKKECKELCIILQNGWGIVKNATVTIWENGKREVYIPEIKRAVSVKKWEYEKGKKYIVNNIKVNSDEIIVAQIKNGAFVYEII